MNFNNNNSLPEKKQVEVQIGDIKYNLTTNESEEYINGIAKYINNKIEEISGIYKNLNKNTAPFFLTISLNIADDLFKQRKQFAKSSNSLKALEENFYKLNIQKSSLESLKEDLDKKDSAIKKLKDEISELEMKKNLEITSLKDENLNILREKELEFINLNEEYKIIIENKDKEINNLKEDLNEKNSSIKNLEEKILKLEISKGLEEKYLKDESNNLLNEKKEEIENKDMEIAFLKEKINSLETNNTELSNLEDESLNLLYEKEKEIDDLKKEIEFLNSKLNINKNY